MKNGPLWLFNASFCWGDYSRSILVPCNDEIFDFPSVGTSIYWAIAETDFNLLACVGVKTDWTTIDKCPCTGFGPCRHIQSCPCSCALYANYHCAKFLQRSLEFSGMVKCQWCTALAGQINCCISISFRSVCCATYVGRCIQIIWTVVFFPRPNVW